MKPTVGRIVHFYPPGACRTDATPDCYAAIVTAVHPEVDGVLLPNVDLATFGPQSLYFQLNVPYSPGPATYGRWQWPERTP